MPRYSLKPDFEKNGSINGLQQESVSWLDLIYMAQLSSIYDPRLIMHILPSFPATQPTETLLESMEISHCEQTSTLGSKRKLESLDEEDGRDGRKGGEGGEKEGEGQYKRQFRGASGLEFENRFEAEMNLYEGFRFGPILTFKSFLQSLYSSLFGIPYEWGYCNNQFPWTWIISIMAHLFCQPALWKVENLSLLVSFTNHVILFFKHDRDLLRNVILVYRKCVKC